MIFRRTSVLQLGAGGWGDGIDLESVVSVTQSAQTRQAANDFP